jgi:hypothetical protein
LLLEFEASFRISPVLVFVLTIVSVLGQQTIISYQGKTTLIDSYALNFT